MVEVCQGHCNTVNEHARVTQGICFGKETRLGQPQAILLNTIL